MASFLLHICFHLRILLFVLLPVFKLLMVLGGISRLGNGNVVSFSTTHLQLKCHLEKRGVRISLFLSRVFQKMFRFQAKG